MRHIDCYGCPSYVIRKCFQPFTKHRQCDMFSRSAAGKLFQTVGPLTVKLWSPQLVVLRGTESCPDTAERR